LRFSVENSEFGGGNLLLNDRHRYLSAIASFQNRGDRVFTEAGESGCGSEAGDRLLPTAI
jgi:hypothetical protein